MENGKKLKILIVDDDDIIRDTYVQVFKQKGFDVLEAADGLEGVDVATKENPDVILTGIIMPRMDGFGLIKTLRENVDTKKIPVAILSHLGREEDRKKAREFGISEFMIQGAVTANEIVKRVKNLTHSKPEDSYRISFDSNAWDAPRLAATLSKKSFKCPVCQSLMLLELRPKAEETRFDASFRCPRCG